MNAYILALIVILSVVVIRFLPPNKYIAYLMLVIGMSPMAYFYSIKYYYKDHAANTAGAFILFAVFCSVILLEELKNRNKKWSFMFDSIEYISVAAGACYISFYGSKISLFALIAFFVFRIQRLVEATIYRNKGLYTCFCSCLILGSVAISIVTRGVHHGLTSFYINGGIIPFIAVVVGLIYWLTSLYGFECDNRTALTVFASVVCSMVLLWLDPSFVQFPLILFICVDGYVMKTFAGPKDEIYDDSTGDIIVVKYSKKERGLISIVFAAELFIAIFVLGPLDIFAGNSDELYFGAEAFLPYTLIIGVIVATTLACLLMLIKETWFGKAIKTVFILEVCMYIQTMFMNIKLQELNGEAMSWDGLRWFMPINLIIWICVVAVIIRVLNTKFYKNIMLYAGLYLVAVQTVAVLSLIPMMINSSEKEFSVFSDEKEFSLAKNDNIIVFLLDLTARDDFDIIRETHPDILDNWCDFTEFRNADSDVSTTYPSIVHMITGIEYDETNLQWRQEAWTSERCEKFFDKIHSEGYEFNLFTQDSLSVGVYDEIKGRLDNAKLEKPVVNRSMICGLLLKATIYKSVPYVLKPKFEVYSHEYDNVVKFDSPCPLQNYDYKAALLERGLSISNDIDNQIAVTHIRGMHFPIDTDENGDFDENTTQERATIGLIRIMDMYLEELKNTGKYDDSTIFITADHGSFMAGKPQPIFFVKRKGEKHEEMKYTNAPIRHGDFQATMMSLIDEQDKSFGPSIWDFKDDEIRRREYQGVRWLWPEGEELIIVEYEGNQDALLEEIEKAEPVQ